MKWKVLTLLLASLALTCGIGSNSNVSAAGKDDFTITDFDVNLNLGRDKDGHSTLRTVETITADFPETDENHGLERNMVKDYDGHSTDFKLVSVTDEKGRKLPYHWEGYALRIGDADTYVHGLNTHRVVYTQRDVTKYYQNTNYDEFYWDAIGVEWRVPIERATVRLTVAPDIQGAVKSDTNCYTGLAGSTALCNIDKVDGSYVIKKESLRGFEGVTVALGFANGTFVPYQPSLAERLFGLWTGLTVITTIIGIGIIIWLLVRARHLTYRSAELGTIVPEYLPPKNAGVAVSAAVSPGYRATMAAQLTDLAVRHYIQILQTRIKKVFLSAQYDIKIMKDIRTLRDEEREILSDMFGYEPAVGDRLSLRDLKDDSAVYARFLDNEKKLHELIRHRYGLEQADSVKRGWFSRAAVVLVVFALLTLSPALFVACLVAFGLSKTLWVLSDEGLGLQRYLKGLQMYIGVAEKDRLKMLQSPEGAEKVALNEPTDPAQLVKLYEKVLPYAILFGQEKEWTKQLGEYYASTNSSPDWYSGNTAFNAYLFGSMITSFSNSVSAASSYSSSAGGSGGGFSGGGGGGGGGGGW